MNLSGIHLLKPYQISGLKEYKGLHGGFTRD